MRKSPKKRSRKLQRKIKRKSPKLSIKKSPGMRATRRRSRKPWKKQVFKDPQKRLEQWHKDKSCYLVNPTKKYPPKYPICDKKGNKKCQGIKASKARAVSLINIKRTSSKTKQKALKVKKRAVKLSKKFC
tara:strand:+ start:18 stop:407 length:390 start_codon:yes stop_codon:yes gene_type:complete